MVNYTCNSTLDDMRIGQSEVPIVDGLTFHDLAVLIGGSTAAVAIIVSLFLIFMHATHYTKKDEQRHIIRILFMVPIYSISSFLSVKYYWWEVYFEVLSECYEAFAIASFFALLCHYIAPSVHDQKEYFRNINPKQWVWPMGWFAKCFGGQTGPFRTPRSGLTWFNVIWFGIYQYCFIRVAMTITAVVTESFGKYCQSSDSPLFAHVWILVIESIAVTVAMYCVIQFYVELRKPLASKKPLLKVLAIKAVIFLSFWQSLLISFLTSQSLGPVLSPSKYVAYPDLLVGVPNLLLCIEMMIFAFFHLFAFPYQPYRPTGVRVDSGLSNKDDARNQGGFLGIKALIDAMNPWDLCKAFARGTRWFFVGRKNRHNDRSYKNTNDVPLDGPVDGDTSYKGNAHLPIADEFRKSKFGLQFPYNAKLNDSDSVSQTSESLGLISNAQPSPSTSPLPRFAGSAYTPARQRYDANGFDLVEEERLKTLQPGPRATPFVHQSQVHSLAGEIGTAYGGSEFDSGSEGSGAWPQQPRPQYQRQRQDSRDEQSWPTEQRYQRQRQDSRESLQSGGPSGGDYAYNSHGGEQQQADSRQAQRNSHQVDAHAMLWGPRPMEDQGQRRS